MDEQNKDTAAADAQAAAPEAATSRPKGQAVPISQIAPKEIFADADRVEFESLVGATVIIDRVKFLKGEHGKYAVFAFTRQGEDKAYSTSTGGVAVVDKLQQVVDKDALPVIATVDQSKAYYDLI